MTTKGCWVRRNGPGSSVGVWAKYANCSQNIRLTESGTGKVGIRSSAGRLTRSSRVRAKAEQAGPVSPLKIRFSSSDGALEATASGKPNPSAFDAASAIAPAAPDCFRNDRLVLSFQSMIVSFSLLKGPLNKPRHAHLFPPPGRSRNKRLRLPDGAG